MIGGAGRRTAVDNLFVEAQQLAAAGRADDALARYRTCIARDNAYLPAHFALGQLLVRRGEYANAHASLSRAFALSAQDVAARRIVTPALAALLADFTPNAYAQQVDDEVRHCLADAAVDPQTLALMAARLLLLKYAGPQGNLDAVASDPLWLVFLHRCMNVEPRMERRLTSLRRVLLTIYAGAAVIPVLHRRLAWAIAIQAHAGQYVWPKTAIEDTFLDGDIAPPLRAMYRPLADVPARSARAPDQIETLAIKRMVRDRTAEQAIASALPALASETADRVSRDVRAQYEEHPYPRWQAPPAPRRRSLALIVGDAPAINTAILPPLTSVLIAGCGTGYEAIGVARTDPSISITAIDLSRASLAYAQRMADELGVETIRFIQGNLLDAASLGVSFPLIYSTGVLHHMADPAAGLASLANILAPGGAMRIALYSHRARAPIRAAHSLIKERAWSAMAEHIRAFRAVILEQPAGTSLAALRDAPDFYSLSGCRDLAFHVCEHQFTTPEIAVLVRNAGLQFIGLELANNVRETFAAVYGVPADPLDLDRWDEVEEQDPTLFIDMYYLWCQKPITS